MADTRTSGLTALTAGDTDKSNDVLPIADVSATTTKKITPQALIDCIATQAKGKIYVSDGTNMTALTVGSNDQVLTADSAQTTGVKWASAAGSLVILDNHEASGAESTYTYTPGSALSMDSYSMIIVEWDTVVDGAMNLLMRINGVTGAAYNLSGNRNDGSTNTVYNQSGATSFQIASSTLLVGNGYPATGYIIIQANPDIGGLRNTRVQIKGMSYGDDVRTWELFAGHHTTNPTENSEITSITILTSANNMKAESRITTYGVKRV